MVSFDVVILDHGCCSPKNSLHINSNLSLPTPRFFHLFEYCDGTEVPNIF